MQQVDNRSYTRVPSSLLRPKDARGRAHSLWLGADRLLLVQTGSFRQTVTRVDLRDIEAVTVRLTATYAWTNALAALPCVIGAGLGAAASTPWAIFGAGLALPCLLILLVNLWLGRTCECRLQTRVSTHTLAALCRYRYAGRALPLLARHIEAAQADLPSVADSLQRVPAGAGVPWSASGSRPPRARQVTHALFFALLDVQALLLLLVVRLTTVATLLLCTGAALVLIAVALFCAVHQHRVAVALRLRVVTWCAAGGVLCAGLAGYLFFMFAIITQGMVDTGFSLENQADRLALRYARQLAHDGLSPWLHWTLLAAAIVAALLAMVGFAVFFTVPMAPAARPLAAPPAEPPAEAP
jgi:hypothetical protein